VKRGWIIGVFIIVSFGACGLYIYNRNKEPVFQGQSLTKWLLLYERSTGLNVDPLSKYDPVALAEADTAVNRIGTNAIPWLLKWIQCEPNSRGWRSRLGIMADKLPGELGSSSFVSSALREKEELRAAIAIKGFQILGTNASSSVPELNRVMNESKSVSVSAQATYAMSFLGVEGLSRLLIVLENPAQPSRRRNAASAVGAMAYLGTNVARAIPVLVRCLQDPDSELAEVAADSLGRLAALPELTVPALGRALQDPRPGVRTNAARSLNWLGDQSRPALTSLIEALNDSHFDTRLFATNAILKVDPEFFRLGSTAHAK
jgi:hypothetical protein